MLLNKTRLNGVNELSLPVLEQNTKLQDVKFRMPTEEEVNTF